MKKNGKKRAVLKPSDPVPEDIHWEWLEVIKSIQAACKDNNGFGHLTLSVSVHRNKPILWAPPVVEESSAVEATLPAYKLLRLSPRRVSEFKMSSTVAAILMSHHQE